MRKTWCCNIIIMWDRYLIYDKNKIDWQGIQMSGYFIFCMHIACSQSTTSKEIPLKTVKNYKTSKKSKRNNKKLNKQSLIQFVNILACFWVIFPFIRTKTYIIDHNTQLIKSQQRTPKQKINNYYYDYRKILSCKNSI